MIANRLDLSRAVGYHTGAFPPRTLDYERLLPPLEDAAASLARYDARMTTMVNAELLLAPLRRQDAVASSRMEGTISTIEDVFRIEAEEDAGTVNPFHEARNEDVETYLYSLALRQAREALDEGAPLSEYLIRSAHQTLLSFGRGAAKQPGRYKTEQNYVGDTRRGDVSFIPIAPEHLPQGMHALIDFMNDSPLRPLLRTGLAHVEFEALHPFQDGNGRIGRMLITLMLWRLGVISAPNFFVSGYFETHKAEYVDGMREVSASGDWTGWLVFFLTAMHAQAKVNLQTADRILALYAEMRDRFRQILNSAHHDRALDYIFRKPVFRNDRFAESAGIPATSARLLTRRLIEGGLLRTLRPAAGRRAALLAFDPLLGLLAV